MFGIKEIKQGLNFLYRDKDDKDREIKKLNEKVNAFENEIEKLKWMIENPNPYKVGQKLKDGSIITEVFLHWNCGRGYSIIKHQWMYKSIKPLSK